MNRMTVKFNETFVNPARTIGIDVMMNSLKNS